LESSKVFDSDEEAEIIRTTKYYELKSYKVGVMILGSAIIFGVFVLPFLVDNEVPNIGDLIEDSGGIIDIQKNSDKVELSLGSGSIYYYDVITEGKWSGDYVDGQKVPKNISLETDKMFPFRCYYDEVLGTETYFGTFRSLEGNPIEVTLFRDEVMVDRITAPANQAVIIEGIC
jgi:hypothetical protein